MRSGPRAGKNARVQRRIADAVGYPRIRSEVVTMKDFHRQDTAPRSDADRAAADATRADDAGAGRAVDVVSREFLEREPNFFGRGLKCSGSLSSGTKSQPAMSAKVMNRARSTINRPSGRVIFV